MTLSRQSLWVGISLLALALASGCAAIPIAQPRFDRGAQAPTAAGSRSQSGPQVDQDVRFEDVAGPERTSTASAGRTISYRAASFTDPTLDISPDGQRLYFAAMGEIYAVPITGGLAKALPLGGGWKERPVVSPDGLTIGFLSDAGGGITAWRSRLSADRPPAGTVIPGFEATTLAWIDDASLGSAVGSTSRYVQLGVRVDYEGEHGSLRQEGPDPATLPARPVFPSASMSADHEGNVFLHRPAGIVRIDASTGIEDVIVAVDDGSISQPRVTADGTWLGLATKSGDGTTHLVLRNLASGEVRNTGCRLNATPRSSVNYGINPEPSYAFIPGQQAVVLERDGLFHRCAFDGVETPIPVEADVTIDLAPRVRPSLVQENSAPRVLLDLASTGDGRIVAFGGAGHLWLHDRSTGRTNRISTSEALERTPAFSADGRHLAYVERFQDQSSSLRVLDLETGGSTVLLHSQDVLANPAWSPDGRRIAFIERPVTGSSETTLRWLGLDGSTGVVGPITTSSPNFFPTLAWDASGSTLLYTQDSSLISHPLDGEPRRLLSADDRAWDVSVSPSRRFVALGTRDGVYITPVLLSSGTPPAFSWSDIRSMKRVWAGGADHLQWLADDSLLWTVQSKLMRALPGEEPQAIADLSLPPVTAAEPERHAYIGATVISMDRAGTIDDAVIVTRGRTLEYVGTQGGAPDLTGIATTDLSGKWIVPGFVDVHAHNLGTPGSEYNLPVTQYNLAEASFGVTTIFDPSEGSLVESAVKWEMSQRNDFLGPTTYGTGVPVSGSAGGSFLMADVESYEHALVLASDLAERGGLMIKAYQQGTRQQRQWLAQAARATGLGITAHEDEAPATMLTPIIDGFTAVEHTIAGGVLREDIKQFLIQSQVPLTPTLVVTAEMHGLISGSSSPEPRRDCLVNPAKLARYANAPLDTERLLGSPIGYLFTDYADLLNRGAKVAIGGHGEAPGLDFHWELELLSLGGATPMNLLQAATVNGAEKLGLESRIGSLVEGKDADFIVLDANPLDDIRNARNIERVVRRGRPVTWPAGPAPQSWRSAKSWDDCQRWNFGLGAPGDRSGIAGRPNAD